MSSTSTTAQATNTAHQETTSKNGWLTGLNATHFWDCNGGACDATTLNPWDDTLYKYAAQYAPQDPADHGGAKYVKHSCGACGAKVEIQFYHGISVT